MAAWSPTLTVPLALALALVACSSPVSSGDTDALEKPPDGGRPATADDGPFQPLVDPCDGNASRPVLCFDDDPTGCEHSECVFEGVCYPSGATTEDGCCTCIAGEKRCLDIPSCPSSRLIGRRCAAPNDCNFPGTSSGLVCRQELLTAAGGEPFRRGICTRTCDRGCPRGTECISSLRAAVTEPFDEPVCMRVCNVQDDCERIVGGQPLGSWCTPYEGIYGQYCN
jgi:hypothetical protein